MERKVLAALDLEGKQDRGSDSERRGYSEERPRGVCGEQAEGDRSYGEHEVDQRHHGDHAGIGWDDPHQEDGDCPAGANDCDQCDEGRAYGDVHGAPPNGNRPHSGIHLQNGG